MNWKDIYRSRLKSAEEAVREIKSGDRVVVGHAAGEPALLLDAMVRNHDLYRDVEIVHMVAMGEAEYCLPEYEENFIHNSFFAGATTRKAIEDGRAVFTPANLSSIPSLFTEGIMPANAAFVMLSPPDDHGFCSFGISVDYTRPAALSAGKIIAEVTPYMPRTCGETFIHVSQVHAFVETETRPIVLAPPVIGEVDEKIGSHVAELINDGDCLQLGIGAVPDSILQFLTDKKDLGVHTEMFSDGVVDLVEKGIINCTRKNYHRNRIVATFFMGTEKLYRFVDNNPFIEMYSCDYTNNPAVIAKNDNMVAVNSSLQVDFSGQAVSDTIGARQYSGTGGQVDFVRGGTWSRGGRSVLAFHSTAAGGKISRIVPRIDEGACVTTPRADVQFIVTEYGIADLRGKSIPQRAKALINIAHPDFREELERGYYERYRARMLDN